MLYSARPEHGCIQIGKTLASRTTFPICYLLVQHQLLQLNGGHWTSNPDTSLAGDSESRNLPLFTDVTTREVGTGNWKHADTGRPSGARHDILARRQHEDKPPHCEAQGCLSLLHGNVQQP